MFGSFGSRVSFWRDSLLIAASLLLASASANAVEFDGRQKNPPDSTGGAPKWEALVRDAGKQKGGLVCEARIIGAERPFNNNMILVVSIRNVSNRKIEFLEASPGLPFVMIQDGEGTLVRLSKEGTAGFRGPEIPLYNYSPPEIQPGRALKFDVPLRKYFAINRKGRYKVLAGAEREIISGEVERPLKGDPSHAPSAYYELKLTREVLVATPLQLTIGQ